MRVQKLGIASESIGNQLVSDSNSEFQFPLLLSPSAIKTEKEALDDMINSLGLKKADKEKLQLVSDELHDAALKSYRYCFNYRIGIVDQNNQPTGETVETLKEQNVPMVNNRPVRIGRSCWLNSYDNGEIQRLGAFNCKKRVFFEQMERQFQVEREEKGLTAPAQEAEQVENPFGDQ
jgi:hypothetical protein